MVLPHQGILDDMTTRYLACDLGAESGRLMLGSLSDAVDALHAL